MAVLPTLVLTPAPHSMLTDTDLPALTDLACRLADAAGAASLPHFRSRGLEAGNK